MYNSIEQKSDSRSSALFIWDTKQMFQNNNCCEKAELVKHDLIESKVGC